MEPKNKRKTWMAALALFVITACLAAPAPAKGQYTGGPVRQKLFTKHFNGSLFKITKYALYSVEVLLNDKEYPIGKDTIGIIIHSDKDEDVKGAALSITYRNVDTGRSIRPAAIVDKKNGLYIVSGLDHLSRPGRWQLGITVNKNGVKDSANFELPGAFKKLYPKGRYAP